MLNPLPSSNARREGEHMIGPGGQTLLLPDGDDDTIIGGPVLEQLLKQAGIDPRDWDKFD